MSSLNTETLNANVNGYPSLPQVAVGAVIFHENRVLLVKRGHAPAQDMWSIPGGRVRLGETMKVAAEREILEETGIRIKADEPCFTFDVIEKDKKGKIRFHYVITDLCAQYISGEINPGDDAADAKWVSAEELADMPVNPKTLQLLVNQFNFK